MASVVEPLPVEERWGASMEGWACPRCQHVVLAQERAPRACPWCQAQAQLSPATALVPAVVPEMVVPFTIDREAATRALAAQVAKLPRWLRPADLSARRLAARLSPVFVPAWLVDSRVQARWHAEVGFDYDVKTHREQYAGGQWRSMAVHRTHIDWEPRAGTFDRQIDNVAAPGMSTWAQLEGALGAFDTAREARWTPEHLRPRGVGPVSVVMPNLSQAQAWQQAQVGFLRQVRSLILRACGGQHLEKLDLDEAHDDQHWTLRLLPMWTTWYRSDRDTLEVVRLSGQSGAPMGKLIASRRKAKRAALTVGALAAVALAVGYLASVPPGFRFMLYVLGLTGGVAAPLVFRRGARIVRLGRRRDAAVGVFGGSRRAWTELTTFKP
jgi:hypothetical protein